MKNVLLATDFSKNSKNAIEYALRIYREELDHVRFTLLHSYKVNDFLEDSRFTPVPSEIALKKAKRSTQEKLKRLEERFKKYPGFSNLNINSIAVNKSLISAVKEQIKENGSQLMVLGTRGHTNSNGITYGSHTLNLIEEIEKCPVLAVPNEVKLQDVEEIVLANSFKTELMAGDLAFLISFSKILKASIRVLHISEEGELSSSQQKNRELLTQKLKDVPHSFHSLENRNVPLGIYSFTESRGSSVIAFINKKHNFIENTFFDPVYRDLAHYSRVPLLVLHQPH